MSTATGSNTAMPAPASARSGARQAATAAVPNRTVERALAAAIQDADRIGELLDVLRTARLWLPLPDDGSPVLSGTAVTLPTVSYLGSDFVPAYSSPELLEQLARADRPAGQGSGGSMAGQDQLADDHRGSGGPAGDARTGVLPHVVVGAADLARLLPPDVGIALNAGASESVPVYPRGVSYLAGADEGGDRIEVGPLPVRPDGLLASIAAELMSIPVASSASAAWLRVQFAGEGLLIAVVLDEPADSAARDSVVAAVERAAWQAAPQDAGFPIDVTFPGESEPDQLDECVSAVGTAFYRR